MLGRSLKHSKNERKEGETKKEGWGIGFVEFSFEKKISECGKQKEEARQEIY